MQQEKEIIVANDWTRNWQASIAVKITAITLWPTIIVAFIAAYFLLYNLEDKIKQQQLDTSAKIAYHASDLWPTTDKLSFYEKLEQLRHDYRELDLAGFQLIRNDQIFTIGELKIHSTYYDLHLKTGIDQTLGIRTFFPEPKIEAELSRNKIIGIIFLCIILFGIVLSLATRIILDKPLQGLVDASKKISEGHQNVRVDTSREDEFGTLSRFFNKMVDNLIEQKHFELEAKTDFLTGIANRRHFDEVITYELRRNARTHNPITLIMCDVDYFKQYNDLYDHIAGDLCLKHIARTLESVFNRAGDLVARYGGEEFVIILPNTDKETGIRMANRLRDEVKKLKIPHDNSSVNQYVTLSVGVATLTDHITDPSAANLVRSADQALYLAKQNGRDRVETSGHLEFEN